MISTIYSTSPALVVGCTSYGGGMSGPLLWNSNSQQLQVLNGVTACDMPAGALSIGLSGTAQSAIDWATKKMLEEQNLDLLCQSHPGLADLRDQFEVMKRLLSQDAV